MRKINALIIVILSVAFSGLFLGCVTDTASLKIEKSLPQNKLAYYNDSFDKFRTDLWDKAGSIYDKAQEANFKLAEMRIENGKLRVRTKPGCFSKGGVGSKFTLRGDFDIQVDCRIDFLEGVYDMDQYIVFLVIEKGKPIATGDAVFLRLLKMGGHDFSTILSIALDNGRFHRGDWSNRVGNFDGTLRIVRIGTKITTLYRTKEDKQWEDLGTFGSTSNDLGTGLLLQNFLPNRTSITARSPITATFDNFKINAAQEIIEEDI
jgi:hypothetical protein